VAAIHLLAVVFAAVAVAGGVIYCRRSAVAQGSTVIAWIAVVLAGLGQLAGLLALKARIVPINAYTLSAILGFVIWCIIQTSRAYSDLRRMRV